MEHPPNPNRNFCIIVNPNAGGGRSLRVLPAVENELTEQRFSYTVFKDNLPVNLTGFTDLIIMGGDGTIHQTINHFIDIDIPIIILPTGTGNDFSFKLSGKRDCMDILKEAIHKEPVSVDAGICNGRIFLNGVGIGFDGEVVRQLGDKKSLGFLSYLLAVLKTIFWYKESMINIDSNEVQIEKPCMMISVANGSRYGGGFVVAPKAIINDGVLDLVLVEALPVLQRLRYLPLMKKGGHVTKSFVKYQTIEKVIITSQQILPAHVDGELLQSNRFEIGILKGKYLFTQ
jgi:diacylglycerol kinase (ATP)